MTKQQTRISPVITSSSFIESDAVLDSSLCRKQEVRTPDMNVNILSLNENMTYHRKIFSEVQKCVFVLSLCLSNDNKINLIAPL